MKIEPGLWSVLTALEVQFQKTLCWPSPAQTRKINLKTIITNK